MNSSAQNPAEEAVVSEVYHKEIIEMCAEGLTEPVTFSFSTVGKLQDFLTEYMEKDLYKISNAKLVTLAIEGNPIKMNLGMILFATAISHELGAFSE